MEAYQWVEEKFLFHAGKENLLKSVIEAIPTYTMSVFWLPKTLCREINSMIGKFWWGHKDNDTKIAWMSWKGLRRNKLARGLGYRDLEIFNSALLVKQGWRLTKHPETLVARVYREKYYPEGEFLGSSVGTRPSYVWRSIWTVKPLLNEGLIWWIGDGTQVRIRGDKWIPTTYSHMIQAPLQGLNPEARVCDIINIETNWWNIPLIEQVFPTETVEHICN